MRTSRNKAAVLGGTLFLTALALPAARAQTPPDTTATPPAATTPEAAPATPPADATPATAVPAPETPPAPKANRFRIGPTIGVFLPSNSKTRDRFGSSWLSIGVGLGSINPVSTKGTVALDLNLLYHGRDGNHALFVPVGIGYRVALSPGTDVVPYVGASADLNFTDITSNPDNIHNKFQLGVGATAFVGVNFGDSAFLEARYYALSSVSGFDLSGLGLDAGYRF